MKAILNTLFAAAVLFSFAACSRDEKSALEDFKKEMKSIKEWTDAKDKEVKANPMAGMAMINDLQGKMKAVKTDGLPADLKEAWAGFNAGIDKAVALLAEFPKDPAKMQAFVMEKAAKDPKFMEEFGKKFQALDGEMKPAIAKMTEAAKKYGIEGMDKIAPK